MIGLVGDEYQNILHLAGQEIAKVIDCDGADWFVVLESVEKASADAIGIHQLVC